MAAFTDPVAKLRGAGIAPASISHPMLQASGVGGHSPVTFSAKSALDTFSRVSNGRSGGSRMGGNASSALNLQSATEAFSEGLLLKSNLSLSKHRTSMAIIRNIG